MAKHNDALFKREFQKGFRKQYTNGLVAGTFAMAQVICEKAKDESKSAEERISDIISFCETSFPKKQAAED